MRSRRIWIIGAMLAAGLALVPGAHAQTTTVTGMVKDPNGIPYNLATIKAQLILATGTQGPATVTLNSQAACSQAGAGTAPCQVSFTNNIGPTFLNSTGSFSISVTDNSMITPAGSQWLFTVSETPGVPGPWGVGPVTFSSQITISGASQSISSTLTAAAPSLISITISSGSGLPCTTTAHSFQYNNAGAFGCVASMTYDSVNDIITANPTGEFVVGTFNVATPALSNGFYCVTGSTPSCTLQTPTSSGDTPELSIIDPGTASGMPIGEQDLEGNVLDFAAHDGGVSGSCASAMCVSTDDARSGSNSSAASITASGAGANIALNLSATGGTSNEAVHLIGDLVQQSGNIITDITGGGVQCVQVSNAGQLSGTGAGCGSSGGGITGATNHGLMYATGATTGTSTAAATNGQLLIGSTGANPVAATITGTAPVVITNGAGSIAASCPTCATTTSGGALSGTSPITLSAGGAIGCATCATGPGSSTNTDLASFNGTGGLALQDSGIASTNVVTAAANYTNGDVVQAAGNNKTTSDSGVAAANLVTAAANFTNADLIQAAGANKTTSDSGIATANVVTAASAAAAANQVCAASGASKTCTYIDFPDVKQIPAANCNNTTAGDAWSIGSGGTASCRAGTNNQGGFIVITDTSSTFAQFTVAIPEDWDTSTNPYIRFGIASTDATSGHTIIPAIKVSCSKGDGTTTDDVTFNASHSLSTTTLNATANQFWSGSNVQMNSTDVTGCVAGAMMVIQVGRATDTATNAEFYYAAVTFARRIQVQPN